MGEGEGERRFKEPSKFKWNVYVHTAVWRILVTTPVPTVDIKYENCRDSNKESYLSY